MTKAEQKLQQHVTRATLEQLELSWDASHLTENFMVGAIIRTAITNELERRYPEKFDDWLWSDNTDDFSIFAN